MDLEDFDPLYLVTLDEIFHAHWAARRRYRIQMLAEAIAELWPQGHPTRLIQVTGTNGKGSTSHYLAQGLRAVGPSGSWTGPHVFDYAERIHLNGEKVAHRDLVRTYRQRIIPIQDRFTKRGCSFTFAEIGILLTLCLYEEIGAVWGVMEVGNGGRYTPLMALPMAACVLTNVGADHPKSLGKELWQRALEKAGIARPGVPFFTAAEGESRGYVVRTAEAEGASVFEINDGDHQRVAAQLGAPQPEHVLSNMALASKLIQHFYPQEDQAELVGRMSGRLPARFWRKAANVIVDVAHNVNKIEKLCQELKLAYPNQKFHFVLGLSRSRNPLEVFEPILELASSICVTSASHAGQDPDSVALVLRAVYPEASAVKDPRLAYQTAVAKLTGDEVLVLTGSAYMIDMALNPNPFLSQTNESYGRRYHSEATS